MISVVVPVYNEENAIEEVLKNISSALEKYDHEIIVVDDGSTDNTRERAEYKNSIVISHKKNMGKSDALNTGFRIAKGDYIFMIDGDGQFDPADMPKFIEKLDEGYDIVNGYCKKKDPLGKLIFSRIYNSICRKVFDIKIRQFNLGFKAFRREVLEGIDLKNGEHRYIIPILKKNSSKICEVPVSYYPRKDGKSKYGTSRILKGLIDMIAVKIDLTIKNPSRFFFSFGVLFFFLVLITSILFLVFDLDLLFLILVLFSIFSALVFFSFGYVSRKILEKSH